MYVWYHLSTILKRRLVLRNAGLITLCVAFITTLFLAVPLHAATGTNQTISFSGRLSNAAGGIVPDGYYNIQFKIYQDGAGTSAGNPGGTLKWTESYVNNNASAGVQVKGGYFSVTLGSKTAFGSSIDWNQDTLWLSMNVAGTSAACTTFGSSPCTADGEMLPMKQLTAVPYAMSAANANKLGGLEASGFIQNNTTVQTGDFNISGTGIANTIQGNTSVLSPLLDRATSGTLSIGTSNATAIQIGQSGVTTSIAGVLGASTIDSASAGALTIGGTNATSINLAQNVTVAAGKSLTITGGATNTRPASPSEGTLYFDTTTKQLLVYSDGKWKGDSKTASKIVAASNSSQAAKDAADYVADGTGDQTEINSALTAAAGGTVYLLDGTYTINGSISMPNNTTLAGAGRSTVITIPNGFDDDIKAITNSDTSTGTGITIRDLRFNGNSDNQTSGDMRAVYMDSVGSANSGSPRAGVKVLNNWFDNWNNRAVNLDFNVKATISGNTFEQNGTGAQLNFVDNSVVTGNTFDQNGIGIGLYQGGNNTISSNTSSGGDDGVVLNASSSNTVNDNTIRDTNVHGISLYASNDNTLTGNNLYSNSQNGITIDNNASRNTVSSNTLQYNDIALNIVSGSDNMFSSNTFSSNGGDDDNQSIVLAAGSGNRITSNVITDDSATSTNYAIDINSSSASATTLSGNSLGSGSIHDLGTGTLYENQVDASGKLINKSTGGMSIQTGTNSATGFQIQNAAGTSALTVDTTDNSIKIAGTLDTASATALNIGGTNATSITIGSASTITTVQGTLRASTIDAATTTTLNIGATNATSINLAQNVTVAAGKSLTLAGGNTASRPASPTEGMIYYDTTTHQLLTYNGTKWVADKADAVVVAANNSSQSDKDAANYVADGTGDQVEINAALTAASGKKVILLAGTYSANATISIPNNTTLAGVGVGSLIQLADIDSTANLITNSDTSTGTGVTLQDLKIDGQDTLNTAGTQNGIYFNNMGDYAANRAGATLRNVQISNFRSQGIFYNSSDNNTLSGSTISGMDAGGATLGVYLESSSRNNNITDNVFTSNSYAIRADGSGTTNNSIAQNIFRGNSYGIMLYSATNTSITGNNFDSSTNYSVSIYNDSGANGYNNVTGNSFRGDGASISIENMSDNTVNNNKINDSGSTVNNNAIRIAGNSDRNSITGNSVTDSSCTSTCYAITILASTADVNVLSANTLGSNGTINDLGTGTIYAAQLDSNGKVINKSSAGSTVQTSTNSTTAFQVQNAAGTSALTVDTTTNSVLVAGALDTTTAAAMTIGSTNASSITIGKSSSNIATTVLGTAIFKPTTGNDSTTAFQIQRANGTAMLVADSTNQTITFGNSASGNYTVISTSTGAITKYGNARNTKKITLNAEYTGSVLDGGTGSNNTGTMTSSVDLTNRMNYYKWTTSQASNQSYDVVVQVPIPSDFDGWASSNPLSISTYTSNTTNGTITLEARDSSNAVQCNFVSVTPGSTGAWATNSSACTLSSGTYTAGDTMTLRIRMQSPASGDVRVGNINLSYLSKY